MRSWREDLEVEIEGRREIGMYRESRRVRREWKGGKEGKGEV